MLTKSAWLLLGDLVLLNYSAHTGLVLKAGLGGERVMVYAGGSIHWWIIEEIIVLRHGEEHNKLLDDWNKESPFLIEGLK